MQETETKGFGQKGTQINCYGPTRSALGETKSENINRQAIKCQIKSAYQLNQLIKLKVICDRCILNDYR